MQLNFEIEEKDAKIKELEENLRNSQKKLNHTNSDGIKKILTNNSRYNSAPLKSPIDVKLREKINVKEFIPVENQNTYSLLANNVVKKDNTSNFDNSSVSSLSN